MMKRGRILSRTFELLIALFLYAPILVLIIFSFNDSKNRVRWEGFTFKWYQSLFQNDAIMQSFSVTLVLALLSALIATVAGTIAAIGFYRMNAGPRKFLLTVNNIPVVNPDIITGVSLMLVFAFYIGILGHIGIRGETGFITLLIAHITFNIPFVVLSVLPKLRQLSRHSYEAALDLGASPFLAYRRVILPEIMPGVISGALIAFTMSIDDFVISHFTAGKSVQTLPMVIYSMTRKKVSPEINALSTIMFVSILLLLILVNVLQARDQKRRRGA